jgi:UDP-glucose 4-epimerase
VTDLAEAHVLALNQLEKGAPSTAYNLGNGLGFSVRQVIDTAKEITGKDILEKIGARREGDPPILVGDSTKAVKELGWKPQFASLEKILATAWSFKINNQDLGENYAL